MIAYPLESSFYFKKHIIKLNLSFDTVLRFFDLQKDENFYSLDRLDLSLEMLISNYNKVKSFSQEDKVALLQQIYEDFIEIKTRPSDDNTKIIDFSQDSSYIYSSFMQAYGIDLIEQHNILDWRKFVSLFQGLPADTKICEIMNIRAKKYPTPTKYNSEEISQLRRAKAYYALEVSATEAEEQFQKALDRLADCLEQRAI